MRRRAGPATESLGPHASPRGLVLRLRGLSSGPGPRFPMRPRHGLARHGGGFILAIVTTLTLVFMGCATVPAHGPSAPFRITGNLPDATIWVDDQMAGTVADFAKGNRRIAAGFHRVEVRHPGHHSHYQELDVKPDVPQTVRFTLREVIE